MTSYRHGDEKQTPDCRDGLMTCAPAGTAPGFRDATTCWS